MLAGRKPIAPKIWTSVEYSKETTRDQLCEQLEGSIHFLDTLSDVDTAPDLPKMLYQMPHNPTAEQEILIDWVKKLLDGE